VQQIKVDTTGTGNKTLYDAATTDRVAVSEYLFLVSGATTLILKDEAGTEFGKYILAAAGQVAAPGVPDRSRFTAAGDILLNSSADVTVTGHLCLGVG
jgi:hypothetical protein